MSDAKQHLSDSVSLWLLDSLQTREVIDAAIACLVEGVDSPHLRVLAGAAPTDSHFELNDLIERTFDELALQEALRADPQQAALGAMLRKFRASELQAKELTEWAHRYIGHEGDERCQIFVELDDIFDLHFDATELESRLHVEAEAFLAGRPSPTETPAPNSYSAPRRAVILNRRALQSVFRVRVLPSGREFKARSWDDVWATLPELGVPWRHLSYEADATRADVLAAWGPHPDAPNQ